MSLPSSPPSYRVVVGVDIAAATATIVTMTGGTFSRPMTIKNTPQGYAKLQQHLRATGYAPADILVVMEATGSYWIALAPTLALAGFSVNVMNPAKPITLPKPSSNEPKRMPSMPTRSRDSPRCCSPRPGRHRQRSTTRCSNASPNVTRCRMCNAKCKTNSMHLSRGRSSWRPSRPGWKP